MAYLSLSLACMVIIAYFCCLCTYTEGRPLNGTAISENPNRVRRRTPSRKNKSNWIVSNWIVNKSTSMVDNASRTPAKKKESKWELADFVLIRIVPLRKHHFRFLQSLQKKGSDIGIQFWRYPDKINRHTDFWITPNNFNKHVSKLLRLMSIHFEIIDKELLDHEIVPSVTMKNIGNYNEMYHSLEELSSEMLRLVTVYDDILSTEVIGKSFEGRPIHVINLRSNRSMLKPIIFILCGTHPREWLAVSSCQYTLRRLVFDHKYDKKVMRMLKHYDVAMVPMLNPDGYVYTQKRKRMWRKNRSKNGGTRCKGVDLNRNFNYRWGAGGTSPDPCNDIFCGYRPFSESESLALGKYVYHMRRNIAAFLDVHTYGQIWMSPWGFSREFPRDYKRQKVAMKKINRAIKKETGEHYRYGPSFRTLYQTSGTAMDWVYGSFSILHTYGVELRPKHGTRYSPFQRLPREIIPSGKDLFTGVNTLALHMIREDNPKTVPNGQNLYFAERFMI